MTRQQHSAIGVVVIGRRLSHWCARVKEWARNKFSQTRERVRVCNTNVFSVSRDDDETYKKRVVTCAE